MIIIRFVKRTFTYLLENGLIVLPRSCDGEPAPEREVPAIFPTEDNPPGNEKGDLTAEPGTGSVGD
jgi:hypothetical protein